MLNTVLFYDQKIESPTREIADVVQEIASRQEMQQFIDFAGIYQSALRANARNS